jgi:serine/threonine-protein kinase
VLLYTLLTGEVPYERGSAVATAIAHRDDPIPDVRARRPDVPAAVATVVRRAMAKEPGERYPSAAAMRRAVLGAVGDQPVTATRVMAHPPSPASTRRRWPMVMALVVLAAVAAGIVAVALARRDDDGTPATTVPAATSLAPAPTTAAGPTAPPVTAPSVTEPPATVPPVTEPPVTAPPVTEPPVTEPPVTEPALGLPGELGELIPVLTGDPDALGERSEEVVIRLAEVFDGRGPTRREATELRDDVERWRDDGEVSPDAADLLIEVLGPLTEPGNGNGDGNGNGNGGGEDD